MKIISSYKDYYDSSMQYGFDSDLLFVRETEDQFLKENKLNKEISRIANFLSRERVDIRLLFFCGKVYPVAYIPSESIKPIYGTVQDYIDDVEGEMNSHYSFPKYKEWAKSEFFGGDEKDSYSNKYRSSVKGLTAYANYLSTVKVSDSLFIEMDVPYFCVRIASNATVQIIKNPNLGNYSFYKYMDPFTCYQEIRMYLGNILTTFDDMPITTGGDKVIAQQKGFDEMSFRTLAPGKKKENRKINRARKKHEV